MKALLSANTARLNCKIRPDIKAALEDLAVKKRKVEGGGYVGLTRVMNEASLMLLRREGINLKESPAGMPAKPAKALVRVRRKRPEKLAVQA